MTARQIRFLAPGVLGPRAAWEPWLAGLPRLPALETLLACSEPSVTTTLDWQAQLVADFDLSADDPPIAALTRLADIADAAPDDSYWLRADPVHLQADGDGLRLSDLRDHPPQAAEVQQLVGLCNTHFAADGWQLEAPTPLRWYVRLAAPPAVRFTSLTEVRGRDIGHHLPRGPQADVWRGRLNECQMLLHQAAANLDRRAAGQADINSLWFWGGGVLPPGPKTPAWDGVWGDASLLSGLARWARVRREPAPPDAGSWWQAASSGAHLVLCMQLQQAREAGDVPAWQAALMELERGWWAPLLQALRAGRLSGLELVLGEGRVHRVRRIAWWRAWRRRPLPHYLSQDAVAAAD